MIPIISSLGIKLHALENLRGLNCQFDICSCVRVLSSFFKKSSIFLFQETMNVLLLVFSGISLSICLTTFFKTSEKQGNVAILSTTPSHCTLMADSVQWLSQSITAFALVFK